MCHQYLSSGPPPAVDTIACPEHYVIGRYGSVLQTNHYNLVMQKSLGILLLIIPLFQIIIYLIFLSKI
jgi:hypothetical protein